MESALLSAPQLNVEKQDLKAVSQEGQMVCYLKERKKANMISPQQSSVLELSYCVPWGKGFNHCHQTPTQEPAAQVLSRAARTQYTPLIDGAVTELVLGELAVTIALRCLELFPMKTWLQPA